MNETRCPICDSTNVLEIESFQARDDEGWVYLSKILNKNKRDTLEITGKMKPFQCEQCASYFFDPWFSDHEVSTAFTKSISRHQSGWLNLQHALTSRKLSTIQILNQAILEVVVKNIRVTSYAELGMPFNGLHLLNFIAENSVIQRIFRFRKVLTRNPDTRTRAASRVYDILSNVGINFIVLILVFESLARSLASRNSVKTVSGLNLPEASRFFLTDASSYGWGFGDESFGLPSLKIAAELFNLQVIPQADAKQGNYKFDLIGIFNYFDHLSSPLETLENAMDMANTIVFTVHQSQFAGKQHRLAINKDFSTFLNRKYPAWSASNLDVSHLDLAPCDTYNVFLIEKRKSC